MLGESAITIDNYVSIYNFDVDLKKRAEIIKGVINLPDDFNDDSIYIKTKNETNSVNDVIIKYICDDKEKYYSNDGELTELIDEAKIISVQSNRFNMDTAHVFIGFEGNTFPELLP